MRWTPPAPRRGRGPTPEVPPPAPVRRNHAHFTSMLVDTGARPHTANGVCRSPRSKSPGARPVDQREDRRHRDQPGPRHVDHGRLEAAGEAVAREVVPQVAGGCLEPGVHQERREQPGRHPAPPPQPRGRPRQPRDQAGQSEPHQPAGVQAGGLEVVRTVGLLTEQLEPDGEPGPEQDRDGRRDRPERQHDEVPAARTATSGHGLIVGVGALSRLSTGTHGLVGLTRRPGRRDARARWRTAPRRSRTRDRCR